MKHRTFVPAALAAALLAAPLAAQDAESPVDPRLPRFEKRAGLELSGELTAVGSDTMINLVTLWGEKFDDYYPGVSVQVEGKGSSTAPPALIEGTSQLGPMSRPMKDKELDAFVKEFGYEPTLARTCLDALAVFVHKDNPIAERGLTLQQVDAIFSKTRKHGAMKSITTWGQLGLEDADWSKAQISTYGRNSASGTYGYFKKHALNKGDFKDTVKEQPGSASVVQSITNDACGIGYSGIGYVTSSVVPVPLSVDGVEYFEADLENVVNGDYPLGRFLNVYLNVAPNEELDPLRREFFRFIYSREGQEVVLKSGYLPLPATFAQSECEALGIEITLAEPDEEVVPGR